MEEPYYDTSNQPLQSHDKKSKCAPVKMSPLDNIITLDVLAAAQGNCNARFQLTII